MEAKEKVYMPILSLVPRSSLVAQKVKDLPVMWETRVPSLDPEDPLETGMATHSNILACRISWTEESVHGVAKSWTQLSDSRLPGFHSLLHYLFTGL